MRAWTSHCAWTSSPMRYSPWTCLRFMLGMPEILDTYWQHT